MIVFIIIYVQSFESNGSKPSRSALHLKERAMEKGSTDVEPFSCYSAWCLPGPIQRHDLQIKFQKETRPSCAFKFYCPANLLCENAHQFEPETGIQFNVNRFWNTRAIVLN